MTNTTSRTDELQEQRGSPEESGDMASRLSQGATEVTEHALQRVHRTRDRLEGELTQRRQQISQRIRDVSEALGSAGRKLGDDDVLADGLHYVSERIERVASYVEDGDPRQLTDDLRNAVRERPVWFFGGAFVVGLALGRFARSSAETLAEGAEAFAEGAKGAGEGAASGARSPTTASWQERGLTAGGGARRETPAGTEFGQRSEPASGAARSTVTSRDQGALSRDQGPTSRDQGATGRDQGVRQP